MRASKGGEMVYMIYRAVTYGLSPLINLHLRWRKFRRLEHPLRWPERLGQPSLPRPPGSLIWFHAVSLGEGMCVIPVIKRCVERRPDVTVLMTTTTVSAFEVLKTLLPSGVIYQFAPVDTPAAVNAFLDYWKPYALVLVESELWPNLVLGASANGIVLALINARMSIKSFNNWSRPVVRLLTSLMLSKFSLIIPLSNTQAIQFQLLHAPPFVINFSGDLKLGTEELVNMRNMEDLKVKIADRCVWMVSSIHKGEEEVMLEVHKALKQKHPDILTIIVPRHTHLGKEIASDLQEKGVSVALRSHGDPLTYETSIYIVDTLGELRQFYRLTPIAVIGGSFLPGLTGHNISEAAAAGCAVLTGQHVGHFSNMVVAMQRLDPLSILQVSGGVELEENLDKLLGNREILEERRLAAKRAFRGLSNGVIDNNLQEKGVSVALRSHGDPLTYETSIYIVDTLGELRQFYRLTPIAVIGGSFLPGLTGHNISEAAAAGCAVLTGQHVGHFSNMVMAMQRVDPLSILQVSGGVELEENLDKLLGNREILEERRLAAKRAFRGLSNGVIENVWTLLQLCIYRNIPSN